MYGLEGIRAAGRPGGVISGGYAPKGPEPVDGPVFGMVFRDAAEPICFGLASIEHAGCKLLCRGTRQARGPTRQAGDFQYRPRQPVHELRFHWTLQAAGIRTLIDGRGRCIDDKRIMVPEKQQAYTLNQPPNYPKRRGHLIQVGDINLQTEIKWKELEFDLASFCRTAGKKFPIDAIYLFGSRRFRTDSVRSDIDIFFETNEHIKPSHIRTFIDKNCQALDIFVLARGKAMSAINESYICGDNNSDILNQCSAVKLWSKEIGLETESSIPWKQLYASHVDFQKTSLPNVRIQMSINGLKRKLANESLPIDPIIGETESEVAERLFRLAEMVSEFATDDFPGKGSTSRSFVVNPSSEYDFQDLFWIAAKPWIQSIGRERVEIVFDGQKKKSDFSISDSRFIIEMKFAKDMNDKRNIAKTLDGLSRFYSENANVKFLMFIVYARRAAQIDRFQWQDRYSNLTGSPKVVLKVIVLN